MLEGDDETGRLLREATALSKTDINQAIATLERARERMMKSPVSYPVDTWLRLPLYLQRAGRTSDALAEIDRLQRETSWRIEHWGGHAMPDIKQTLAEAELARIAIKRDLIVKRAKARA